MSSPGTRVVVVTDSTASLPAQVAEEHGVVVVPLQVVIGAEVLDEGAVLFITPDGPRGPNRELKRGALAAARMTGLPLVPVGVGVTSAWRIRGWDEFLVPKPFSTVRVAYGHPRSVPRHAGQAEMDEMIGSLRSELSQLAAQVGDTEPSGPFADAGAP